MKRERGMTDIALLPLEASDRNQFILDNQEAFNYGALVEFGLQDDHFEEPDEIISRETIEKSIDGGEAYRIMQDSKPVGGVIIKVERTVRTSDPVPAGIGFRSARGRPCIFVKQGFFYFWRIF